LKASRIASAGPSCYGDGMTTDTKKAVYAVNTSARLIYIEGFRIPPLAHVEIKTFTPALAKKCEGTGIEFGADPAAILARAKRGLSDDDRAALESGEVKLLPAGVSAAMTSTPPAPVDLVPR
jgi:hypothetical protein